MQTLIKSLSQLDTQFHILSREPIKPIPGSTITTLYDEYQNINGVELKIEIDNEDDDLERVDSEKFQYMKSLENILIRSYSETTNGDACSTAFNFDTNHASGPITITITITDALS